MKSDNFQTFVFHAKVLMELFVENGTIRLTQKKL